MKLKLFIFISISWIFISFFVPNVAQGNEPQSEFILPNGQVVCDLTMNQVGNTCIRKTFEEMEKTIRQLTLLVDKNVCDDFEMVCKKDCISISCEASCERGVEKCKTELLETCEAASQECSSNCKLAVDDEDGVCLSACDDGSVACKQRSY